MDITVKTMTPTDFPIVDDVLSDAFSDNHLTRTLLGNGDVRNGIRLLNRRAIRSRHATGLVAQVDGVTVAALLASDSPKCELGGMDGVLMTIDALRALRWRFLKAVGLFRDNYRNHPNWAHRHLVVLGVRRSMQRRGVGAALLQRFCEMADADGASGFLETDSEEGMRLYKRFGFNEVNRKDHGAGSYIYMWRTAKTAD